MVSAMAAGGIFGQLAPPHPFLKFPVLLKVVFCQVLSELCPTDCSGFAEEDRDCSKSQCISWRPGHPEKCACSGSPSSRAELVAIRHKISTCFKVYSLGQ